MRKTGFVAVIFVVVAYGGFAIWRSPERQLKVRFNLCFDKNTPGLSGAFVSYTPYNCDDEMKIAIGEPLEGQWAELSDLNFKSDGTVEIVVESNRPYFDTTCISGEKTVWKFIRDANGKAQLTFVSKSEIPGPC